MIAGGKIEGSSAQITDSVLEYDINSNSYNPVQSLPDPIVLASLVKKDGFMYTFGGYKSGSKKTVARIELTLTSDWEKLEDMETANYDITVIPYN